MRVRWTGPSGTRQQDDPFPLNHGNSATVLMSQIRANAYPFNDLPPCRSRFLAWLKTLVLALLLVGGKSEGAEATSCLIDISEVSEKIKKFTTNAGPLREFTWWLPKGADTYVLPISAGVIVSTARPDQMDWLRGGAPWSLLDLPAFGARYGNRTLAVMVPWPQYAELVSGDSIGVKFTFPERRNNTTPCEIVARWTDEEPLAVAKAFRDWRRNADDIGELPRPRTLTQKFRDLPTVARLAGAAHFYLWGPAMFSRHDVPRNQWLALARKLQAAPANSEAGKLRAAFTDSQRADLAELAAAKLPMDYLLIDVAQAINGAMAARPLSALPATSPLTAVVAANRAFTARALAPFANDPETWGDGLSLTLVNDLHEAGIDRAVLLLSDLYGQAVRPDVAKRANELGYLLGPYDSYHSVHSPTALSGQTWETAQFDEHAYEDGRVVKAEGMRQGGFKGNGFHFAPAAAWPYVQERVASVLANNPYTAWFVDCDATGECFDDYNPLHPATRVDDLKLRRQRLRWLENERQLVVGSEGGSALFADVIHFGHGVHTPYIGHLDPSFREPQSPYYLGRYWPPDSPDSSFKPVPVPPSLKTPYFDPTVRIPLYQAALGDELIGTHHWSFDSLKFDDVEQTRELMEILYMMPPLYHLNREAWPKRRERILQHLAFWGPLHRELATAPLTRFACLSEDRLVQRTTFQPKSGEVTITVNFGAKAQAGFAPYSATVSGSISTPRRVFRAEQTRLQTTGATWEDPEVRRRIEALSSREWREREQAAEALGRMGPIARGAIPHLIERLADEEWQVRKAAATAFSRMGSVPEQVIPSLIAALADKEWQVRGAAAEAMTNIGLASAPAVRALSEALADEEWQVRSPAALALAIIGPPSKPALERLIGALDDEEWKVRKHAAASHRRHWRVNQAGSICPQEGCQR